MRGQTTMRSASIVLAAVVLVASGTASGQDYAWPAYGTSTLETLTYTSNGTVIYTQVPAPTSYSVAIGYTYVPQLVGTTSGDTTTYLQFPFSFTISGTGSPQWPGFYSNIALEMAVTVPTDGQGLDQISFTSEYAFGTGTVWSGAVTIDAPLGTLSTSTELPQNLDAFQQYGLTNPGDSWELFGIGGDFIGGGYGGFGPDLAPEPSSFWLLGIGAAGCWALRRFLGGRRRRDRPAC
jgi:PEP-CTERM motif